ncbi:zinc transporter ZIP14-like isoform X2 [Asterias rubens]|uniref:zinc transporter ZIP14-like isoform X2 n=1 Tax=Asterias rubens TaxID=7604 RepID=UPI001454FA4F|nr:zinc transporter ZIP14-like isoform X2 [Asterias rubens]XP_033638676.1 zinc transporter ZIP14-like isoform X2 [Asterias rubens]
MIQGLLHKKCVLRLCRFIVLTEVIFSVVAVDDATASTGSRNAIDGQRKRRNAAERDENTVALLSSEFFVEEIVNTFGSNGNMNQEQLQVLLQRVGAECYTSSGLLSIHSSSEEQLLNDTIDVIKAICPAIMYQASTDDTGPAQDTGPPTTAQVWGYGVLFVTIINASALMGACIIPCLNKKMYKMVLNYLIGLAIGTLSGNALLCLIPETHGMHVGTHGLNVVWKNTTILGGIYLFFFVERVLKMMSQRKESNHKQKHLQADDTMHVTAMHDLEPRHDMYKITSGDSALGINNGIINSDKGLAATATNQVQNGTSKPQNEDVHFHLPMTTKSGKIRIASVAYMIIFGDGLHNFVDGLAIGVSFSTSVFQGISTSIAVVCEEIPHELGDFAILIKSGMTVKQALTFNFLSALTCYAGLVVGIVVGQLTSAEPYILALAGGMFLYISLVDMLPELNATTDQKEFNLRNSLKTFAIQNAGLLTGYGIMILLNVYEEQIQIS